MVGDPIDHTMRESFSIAYNRSHKADDHTIDAEALAPALLAFSKLLRETNNEFNGKQASAKLLVSAEFENRCFYITFELEVIFEHVKQMLDVMDLKSAKELLQWIGLIRGAGIFTLFAFLLEKRGRKATIEKQEHDDQGKDGTVKVHIEGNNNSITLNRNIYNLSNNKNALNAVRDTLAPLGQDGFDTFEVREGSKIIAKLSPEDARAVIASCQNGIEDDENSPLVESTTAWIEIYSPVYDTKVNRWRFRLGREVVWIDISETSIAQSAIERGGAMVNDSYQVRLRITSERKQDGTLKKPTYHAVEVLKFVSANPNIQGSLFEG